MTAYVATAAAAFALAFPHATPDRVAAFVTSPVGEVAAVLALTIGAAHIAAAYLFPGPRV